jgi:hypothetical protein
MAMIRGKLNQRMGSSDDDCDAAVAEPDPMDALDDLADMFPSGTPKPSSKRRRLRDLIDRGRRTVVETLSVPARPLCTGSDGGATTTISVYRLPMSSRRSNGSFYLRTDDVGWLLAYAADELHFQGVIAPRHVPQSRVGNCPAVAGLRSEWAFATGEWACEFVDGPLTGTTHRCAVNSLSKAQFDEVRANNAVDACWS